MKPRQFIPALGALAILLVVAVLIKGRLFASPAFDLPNLVGRDINGVRSVLGSTNEIGRASKTDVTETWTHDGQKLVVTYDVNTGRVIDFFLPTTAANRTASNVDDLRAAGNLTEQSGRYSVEGVPAIRRPGQYKGLKVTPK